MAPSSIGMEVQPSTAKSDAGFLFHAIPCLERGGQLPPGPQPALADILKSMRGFHRDFVWKSTQVRDLAECLWLEYPIGSLLVWNSQQPEERIVRDAQRPTLWVVDGQQRATALCLLFGENRTGGVRTGTK